MEQRHISLDTSRLGGLGLRKPGFASNLRSIDVLSPSRSGFTSVSQHEDPSGFEALPSVQKKKGERKGWRRNCSFIDHSTWLPEATSLVIAVAALVAIAAILATHQGRTLPKEPALLSINSLVAIFSSILKAAICYPIANGLGELKWIWFRVGRPVSDIDRFDSATRGPWGAVRLLFKFRISKNILALTGALVMIIALAIEPFTQQIIQNYTCASPSGFMQAVMPRTNNYTAAGAHLYAGVNDIDLSMAGAIYQGLLNPPQNESSALSFSCPSGNCTFSQSGNITYSSLAICSSVAEIPSSDISANISGAILGTNFSLPSGLVLAELGWTVPNSNWLASASLNRLLGSISSTDQPLLRLQAILADAEKTCNMPDTDGDALCWYNTWAFNATLYPCIKTYGSTNISEAVLLQDVVSTVQLPFINTDWGPSFSLAGDYPAIPGIDCSPSSSPQGVKTQPTGLLSAQGNGAPNITGNVTTRYAIGPQEVEYIVNRTDILWYDPACTWGIGNAATSAFDVYFQQLFGYVGKPNNVSSDFYMANATTGDAWVQRLYANGNSNMSFVADYMEGLANAMTANMRQHGDDFNSDHLSGQVLINQTCVRVQWGWLALPIILVAITLVFLISTALYSLHDSRTGDVGRQPWKSSSMPLLWCGLQDSTTKRYGAMDAVGEMKPTSDELNVKLSRSNDWESAGAPGRWALNEVAADQDKVR